MALNLYKPGQGYWTRVLSAIGGGMLVLGAVVWIGQQLRGAFGVAEWVTYAQSGIAVVLIGSFGWLFYRWVGAKPRTVDFLIATEGEMKKVNWPARKQVFGSTLVVLGCVAILTLILFVADIIFAWFFQQIGVLEI